MTLRCAAWLLLPALTFGCRDAESVSRQQTDASGDGSTIAPDAAVSEDEVDASEQVGDASTEDAAPRDSGIESEAELVRSGTRLRAQGYRFDGTVLGPAQMHDSQLDTLCSYRVAADGDRYCMPVVEESFAHALPSYLDASCTQGALLRRVDCAPPAPFHLITELGCRDITRVLSVAEASSQTVWYSKEPEGCVAHALLQGQQLYPLGEALPSTTFVRGTVERLPQGGLSHERLVGSDGSWVPVGAYDAALGGSCAPLWLGRESGLRCVASERASYLDDGWFIGEQCTEAVAFALPTTEGCQEPRAAVRVPEDALTCAGGGAASQVFELGAATQEVYTRDFDGVCKRAPDSAAISYSFYELGALTAAQALPQLSIATAGNDRIRPYVWRGDAGQVLGYVVPEGKVDPLLFDAQLNSPCEPLAVAGEVVCAPPMAVVVYSDPDCQQPLLEVFLGDDCALPSPTLVGVRGARPDSCGQLGEHPQITLHRLAGPAPPPATRYLRFQSSCVNATSPAIRARYFEVGESLESSALARLRLTVE